MGSKEVHIKSPNQAPLLILSPGKEANPGTADQVTR